MPEIDPFFLLKENSIVIGDGKLAILRDPFTAGFVLTDYRLATHAELLVANLGRPFPWGNTPHDTFASNLWKKHRIGYGGLVHSHWFVTSDGRFGGGLEVPTSLPGSLRCSLFIDGGEGSEEENEGLALVTETDEETRKMYRKVQLHAHQHVTSDGGHIIVSRINEEGLVHVGFVGRCQKCPNAELISFEQLKASVPDYRFKLFKEWENWSI
jgi:Fe-S cluster biogenesis protein NfuA